MRRRRSLRSNNSNANIRRSNDEKRAENKLRPVSFVSYEALWREREEDAEVPPGIRTLRQRRAFIWPRFAVNLLHLQVGQKSLNKVSCDLLRCEGYKATWLADFGTAAFFEVGFNPCCGRNRYCYEVMIAVTAFTHSFSEIIPSNRRYIYIYIGRAKATFRAAAIRLLSCVHLVLRWSVSRHRGFYFSDLFTRWYSRMDCIVFSLFFSWIFILENEEEM